MLTDDELLASCEENDEITVVDDDEVIDLAGDTDADKQPTKSMMNEAFQTLQNYTLFSADGDDEMQQQVRKLKRMWDKKQVTKKQTQTTIANFFQQNK